MRADGKAHAAGAALAIMATQVFFGAGGGGGAICAFGAGGRSLVGGGFELLLSAPSWPRVVGEFLLSTICQFFRVSEGGGGGATWAFGAGGRALAGGGFMFFLSVPSLMRTR